MTDRTAKDKLRAEIGQEIDKLRDHHYFPEIYKYISLLYPERQTLFDYLPKDTLLIYDEPTRLIETGRSWSGMKSEWATHLLQDGKALPSSANRRPYG